jgi:hypothetical protein
MPKHYCDFNEGCALVGVHYNKRNCKLQIIPVIVSINICTKVWCVYVHAHAHFQMGATSVLLPLIVAKLQWALT